MDLTLLLTALAEELSAFILGAGASVPHVPTIGQIPNALRPFAGRLSSFPAGPIPTSPLRRLIQPLIDEAQISSDLHQWMAGAMTSDTVAVLIEELISRAHWQRLPQYEVFSLIPFSSSITSFNWDGLARARCPQALIIEPHGALRPRSLVPGHLDDLLDFSQEFGDLAARTWLLPGLVMPGEEEAPELHSMRERVLHTWLQAPRAVIIGYSLGLRERGAYDRVWQDTFVEVFSRNRSAPIHIISPDADDIRGALVDRLGREVNVFSWPLRWHTLAAALLQVASRARARTLADLRSRSEQVFAIYREMVDAA